MLDNIQAKTTTPNLLSGKAISRAIRGFLIIESVLHALLHREQVFKKKNSEVRFTKHRQLILFFQYGYVNQAGSEEDADDFLSTKD